MADYDDEENMWDGDEYAEVSSEFSGLRVVKTICLLFNHLFIAHFTERGV